MGRILIAASVALLLVSGCGVTATRTEFVDDYEVIATEVGRGECIDTPVIHSWTAFDDHHIYIRDEEKDTHLLITTKSMCRGLMVAPVVEFPAVNRRICQNGSRIAYRWTPPRLSCGIDNIEIVENEAAALALVNSRRRVEEIPLFDLFFGFGGNDDEGPIVPESEPD